MRYGRVERWRERDARGEGRVGEAGFFEGGGVGKEEMLEGRLL